ncbi:LysR family transcriptional regulator [Janthinobacterium sp.]|uniref:LysR family transcriptional regulator n=1 Tax=Janthinobacterium sp. TaxID=1871054 RepID=UPI00293D9248|nr:LysR family transcriptional regulator [Janthinobacterium sp.]
MDIRQLKAFIAVFEERNITLAAQRLNVTQPTLSVTIRQLEEELGTILFERRARGVDVSADARQLYPQARRLVDQAEAIGVLFLDRKEGLPLSLSLGVDGDIGAGQIDAFLLLARRLCPELRLSLEEGCSGDARLAAEESRCEDELFLPLWEEQFVLAVRADAALARQGRPSMAALARADWIVCPGHSSHQRLLALHGEGGAGLARAASAGSLRLALHMVAAGIGVALLPQSLIEGRADIAALPLAGVALSRRVGLCFAAQALERPALQALHAGLPRAPAGAPDGGV